MKRLIVLPLCGLLSLIQAQVLINEAAHTNTGIVVDEDGELPDWIELYNGGVDPVNMAMWSVTDDLAIPGKWQLPDTVLAPAAHLLIMASEKNRNAYDAEMASVDHWETAVYDDDIWEYFPADAEPDPSWRTSTAPFGWDTGKGGFGFGDDDDSTIITTDVRSVYYRKTFEVADKTKLIHAIINMDYDDGYVVFINGILISEAGLTGIPAYDDLSVTAHEAQMFDGGNPAYITLDSATLAGIIVDGTNVIAVQVHNKTSGSNDLTGRTFLHFAITDASVFYGTPPLWFNPTNSTELHTNFKIGLGETIALFDNAGILRDSITMQDLEAGIVKARIPDAGGWCMTNIPTPDTVNSGDCYLLYAATPSITPLPGFYTGDQTVTISGVDVQYTTDGSDPLLGGGISYIDPFVVTTSTVIKARSFETGKLPSALATTSLLINEPTLLPVVSISATPCDLFDLAATCPAAYDNATSFDNENPQINCVIEYFNADKTFQFAAPMKFEVAGNYSIELDQKGIQFTCDEDFNSPDNINFPLYSLDKPVIDKYHAFRLRNCDNDAELARSRDLLINRMALPTHTVAAANQNVAAFINGEYWGHYVSRERLDPYFCRDNFGANPDRVDMIKAHFSGGGNYVTEAGSDTGFFNLHTYCIDHDLTDPVYYAAVLDQIDEDNWIDYFATEVYSANSDWIGFIVNNIRLFRAVSPDIEWKFMLWDLGSSQGTPGAGASSNTLATAMDDNNFYIDMFNALMENTEFHDHFINRFADLLNYYYTPEIANALIDANTAEIITEMNAQDDKWNTGDSSFVQSKITNLRNFHNDRRGYVRDDIENYYDLNDQVDVTIDVAPAGAGYIKISTIIPETLPWTGVYFDGVPVTITAIANPGYTFVNWTDNPFIATPDVPAFNVNITEATTFTANFNGTGISNPIIISEINYNSDSTLNAGDWIELHNTSGMEIDLTNYQFSNTIFYNDYIFPSIKIAPDGYLVLAEDMIEFNAVYPDVTQVIGGFDFNLSNSGDSITLIDFLGNVITSFKFNDKRPWPVTADNYGRTLERFEPALDPGLPEAWFPGCVGGSPAAAFTPCLENPLVDEINYNSDADSNAGDWFELMNTSADIIDIGNWTVKDKNGNAYVLPTGTQILPDSFIVIYQDAALFASRFPDVTNISGPTGFGLSSDDDIISIYDAGGVIYQSVSYDDTIPYPISPDGGGVTLQIVDVLENINLASNWMESCPEGSPGMDYYFPCLVPEDTTTDTSGEDTTIVESIANYLEGDILIFPNPANAQINISLPDNLQTDGLMHVYDLAGTLKETFDVSASTMQLDISNYLPGVYLIQWINDTSQLQQAFIKE